MVRSIYYILILYIITVKSALVEIYWVEIFNIDSFYNSNGKLF